MLFYRYSSVSVQFRGKCDIINSLINSVRACYCKLHLLCQMLGHKKHDNLIYWHTPSMSSCTCHKTHCRYHELSQQHHCSSVKKLQFISCVIGTDIFFHIICNEIYTRSLSDKKLQQWYHFDYRRKVICSWVNVIFTVECGKFITIVFHLWVFFQAQLCFFMQLLEQIFVVCFSLS